MTRVITLADFRPSPRADGEPWTEARLEEASDPGGEWSEVKTVTLDPLDEDVKEPALRSFTTATDKAWLRIVFLDGEGNEDAPSAAWATSGLPFQPTVAQVSSALRARTYTDAEEGVVGGDLASEFNSDTRPTAEDVEGKLIPEACTDVVRSVGRIPGVLLADARRVAVLGVCKEIERSYVPEQAEPDQSIYQTLRLTCDEEVGKLRQRLQWWVIADHLEDSE